VDIEDILIKDDIKNIIGDFVGGDMLEAESVMLIYEIDGKIKTASAGLSQLEVLGLLETAKSMTLE
jgi:hypothetical protein